MHHKFAVIDNKTILNGSFNWSSNATKSFENIMVIRNFNKEILKFIGEFKKLKLIETETIRKLNKFDKCDCCGNGKIVNILVFSSKTSKYFETSGDIVNICTECDYFENNNEIITNNELFILADNYKSIDNEEEYEVIYNLIFDELNQYINNGITIHAIGQVENGLDAYDDDFVQTNILWKNKFIGEIILDVYEDQDFDVHYDSTSYIYK